MKYRLGQKHFQTGRGKTAIIHFPEKAKTKESFREMFLFLGLGICIYRVREEKRSVVKFRVWK